MKRLWLASGSPRRAELLAQIGAPFSVMAPPDVDESPLAGELPPDYVQRVAALKAEAGWATLAATERANAVVLGADTSVVLNGDILGKPGSDADARAMLARLSGNEHRVLSAVSVISEGQRRAVLSDTRVRFRTLDDEEIDAYVATGEGRDKAGAYGIQGFGGVLVATIEGSFSGVVGLPVAQTGQLLRQLGVPVWVGGEDSQ